MEVKIIGEDQAVIKVQTKNVSYAMTKLMEALRDLEVKVHHASMSNLQDMTLEDLVGSITEEGIKQALITILEHDNP